MMKLSIALTGVAAVSIAMCAGDLVQATSDPELPPSEQPALRAAAANALTVSPGRVGSLVPQVLDVSADGQRLALRIPTVRDAHSDDIARCDYHGLTDVDGMQIALVRFDEQHVQSWTVYRTPTEDDDSCTTEEDASVQLSQAKAALEALGLDAEKRMEWMATPEGDGSPMRVAIEHISDSGYHTYTATVTHNGNTAMAVHSPNPAMGGLGTLEVRGTLSGAFGTVVLFEATHGPAGIWSDWMLSPPL